MPPPPPPPPGPPPPPSGPSRASGPKPPVVASEGPPGAFLLELIVYNGAPFKDHWAFFVRSRTDPKMGVIIHAVGDVRNGFHHEIKRDQDITATRRRPKRIPLMWVDAKYFDEEAYSGTMRNYPVPANRFEASALQSRLQASHSMLPEMM
jgi:hypothetical protein